MNPKDYKPESIAAQALGWVDEGTRAIAPPIHTATTYLRDADNQYRSGRVYARDHNPSFEQAEAVLCELEQGADAMLFASGMAAATAVFQALQPGDHVLAPKVMYWSLRNWLMNFATQWGLKVELVDMTSIDELKRHLIPRQTRLVWLETPANPLWTITDITAVCEVAHQAGARVAVDSTVATPVLTQPLALGADVVMHSATKYLNGHSDVIAGALVTRVKDEPWQRMRAVRAQIGGVLGPFEAWLLTRGMRTLFPRVRLSSASAQRIAEHFTTHPNIREVLYPGLSECQGHLVAAKQMHAGYGGMLSICVHGGEQAAIGIAANVKLWKRATSLGGIESLIEHRSSVEGAGTPAPDDLLRLSVGLESAEDLISDLEQAMRKAK